MERQVKVGRIEAIGHITMLEFESLKGRVSTR
jgi:hypothetical protein